MIKCVICNNKIFHRKADSNGKNVCIRDNEDQHATKIIIDADEITNAHMSPIQRLEEDFDDFKSHIALK